ncbi:hypothetical protein LSM04_009392 [Trypanosoma melophagium]|uniref:uncharacterized protein n=1 Tax=Trypanosoma melophagium TaxID=715481 RepID=UPI00351A3BC2|nr:hypothetical protein LSM04_000675 [Trypanosoma melophagium]KAH9593540.1 hypothetical protein LSM04_009392 [Trypanosoma melophagium]
MKIQIKFPLARTHTTKMTCFPQVHMLPTLHHSCVLGVEQNERIAKACGSGDIEAGQGKSTLRGARTHDHTVKSRALYRLG